MIRDDIKELLNQFYFHMAAFHKRTPSDTLMAPGLPLTYLCGLCFACTSRSSGSSSKLQVKGTGQGQITSTRSELGVRNT